MTDGRNPTVKGRSGRRKVVAGGEREVRGVIFIRDPTTSLKADGKVPLEARQKDRMSDKDKTHQGRRGLAGQRPRARKFIG